MEKINVIFMSRKNVFPLSIKWSFEQARSAHDYTITEALIENSYSLVTHYDIKNWCSSFAFQMHQNVPRNLWRECRGRPRQQGASIYNPVHQEPPVSA